eukprot:TRINITY_DN795_c0_g4_i2.p1 TRINITY_DN795_c0_g4~~TRINITY_DN795_c0_g4_i2.p1  ORF type:complete len:322 (+),score=38.08 TRINITY_DN795_c0_g4_i2:1424-2389(+)
MPATPVSSLKSERQSIIDEINAGKNTPPITNARFRSEAHFQIQNADHKTDYKHARVQRPFPVLISSTDTCSDKEIHIKRYMHFYDGPSTLYEKFDRENLFGKKFSIPTGKQAAIYFLYDSGNDKQPVVFFIFGRLSYSDDKKSKWLLLNPREMDQVDVPFFIEILRKFSPPGSTEGEKEAEKEKLRVENFITKLEEIGEEKNPLPQLMEDGKNNQLASSSGREGEGMMVSSRAAVDGRNSSVGASSRSGYAHDPYSYSSCDGTRYNGVNSLPCSVHSTVPTVFSHGTYPPSIPSSMYVHHPSDHGSYFRATFLNCPEPHRF